MAGLKNQDKVLISEFVKFKTYIDKKKVKQAEALAAQGDVKNAQVPVNDYQRKKESEAQQRREKTRILRLEESILSTEEKIKAIDAELLDEANARDASLAVRLYNEKTELEDKLLKLYEEWDDTQ